MLDIGSPIQHRVSQMKGFRIRMKTIFSAFPPMLEHNAGMPSGMECQDVKKADQADVAGHKKMLEVLAQFRIVFKAVRRHYGEVRNRSGISGAQLWALSIIAERPGVKVGELAAALAIHASTASNLVRDLKSIGLVEGQRHGTDQRMVNLNATAKGRQVLKRAPKPLIGVLQRSLSDLPMSDLGALHLQLSKLIKAMKPRDAKAARTPLSDL